MNQVIVEIAKAIISGFLGILLTLWYTNYKTKLEERKALFLKMITLRGNVKVPQHLIDAMNTIEILFRGKKKIIEKYREYYETLCLEVEKLDRNRQQAIYWDLLREMGNAVGYRHLENKTLDNRYIPQWVMDDLQSSHAYRTEVMGFLRSAQDLHHLLISLYTQLPAQGAIEQDD